MSGQKSRVEVGKGSFPFAAAGVAILVIAVLLLGVTYASRTPYGAEVGVAADLDSAVNEYLAKNEKRFPTRRSFYNCAGFFESMFNGKQDVAIAIEQGAWRPGIEPDGSVGNLLIVSARREKDGEWQISSRPVPDATYDPSSRAADSPEHPCSLAKAQ